MNIRPIRSEADYDAAIARLEELWGTEMDGSPEDDELEVLSILIASYEEKAFPMPESDPIEAIKFRLEQKGMAQSDLIPMIGSSGRVSEVLNRKRSLSPRMMRELHTGLNIPYETLMKVKEPEAPATA